MNIKFLASNGNPNIFEKEVLRRNTVFLISLDFACYPDRKIKQ